MTDLSVSAISDRPPLELHYWPTPNGWKVSIMLEECGWPYEVRYVDIGAGDQFSPEFLKIAPNNRMPAIVDPMGPGGSEISVFESGAILKYLAEVSGRFYPSDFRSRVEVDQWLFWQMGGLGPMAGQAHHFRRYAPVELSYPIERYTKETARLYGVMDRRLADRSYLGGEYSIADMACFPWVVPHEMQGLDLSDYPNLSRWFADIDSRDAVQRGLALGRERRHKPEDVKKDADNYDRLFPGAGGAKA